MNKTTVCLTIIILLTLASGVGSAKCIETTNDISGSTTYCGFEHNVSQQFYGVVFWIIPALLALALLRFVGNWAE